MTVGSPLLRWSTALLVVSAGCATGGGGSPVEPAPVLEADDLAGCTYERVGEVQEQARSGMVQTSEEELRRALGLRARRMGADAVIEFRSMRVGPMPAAAGGRSVTQSRAIGVAIRFTSPTCPATGNRNR